MHYGASLTGGEKVNNSMDLQYTGNMLVIDDDKLYTFKEGDYKRLRLQDIEDMLLLLVQGMLKTLTIKEQKKNRLMRIDELYKFSDATLNDVRERAGAMIQAINQQLRNRRIMRSLENFVGGRPYVGDLWLLERTI
ncbi:hypothetical protein Tco_0319504 [Tanacetum coccineum]